MGSMLPGTWETSLSPGLIAHQRTVSAVRPAPDGTRLAFVVEYDGRTDLFTLGESPWPVQITADQPVAGGSYAWSPDGTSFVFTSATDGKLWVIGSAGGSARRLTLREGRCHSPSFSPNGQWVVFLCDRGEEVEVVAISADGFAQRVLSRGSDFPMAPSWSPDSQQVIWHAYPNNLMPWDESVLVVADFSDAAPRTIASAPRTAYAQARFSPDGTRIVCVCDRGGALNLTEMAVDGSDQVTLHEDQWEHGELSYSPDGRQIVYTRNVDGDYTLWTVPSGGGQPRALTEGPGRAAGPNWSADGGTVSFVYESPVSPPNVYEVDVATGRQTQRTSLTLGGIAASDLALPEHVAWTSAEGFKAHGLLYTPREIQPGRHGCLVEIHGGPMNQSRAVWNGLLQYLVQRGWVVIQPNYRGTLGYGRDYREALFGSWGVGDLADNIGAADLCIERGLVHPDRVVAWGGSAGGYSTLICLTVAPDRFAGGVALFGLYDHYAFGLETHRYERFYVETILGTSADNYTLWHDRSPINHVDAIRSPLLLLQGASDAIVLSAQSETLIGELERHRVDYEYIAYPGEGHGFRKVVSNVDYAVRMDRFLTQKVLRAPFTSPLGTLPYPAVPLR